MSKTLSEALLEVPSLSPDTCMKMLEIMRALKEKEKKESHVQIKGQLTEYREALDSVCFYSQVHQAIVLQKFSQLIR